MAVNANGLIDFEDEESNDDVLDNQDETSEQDDSQEDSRSGEELLLMEALDELSEEDYEEGDDSEQEPDSKQETDEEETSEDQQQDFKNEENAKNAERRRQNEQRLMEKLKQQSPEFQLAQELSQLYGKPVDQLMADIQEAKIMKLAKEQGIPVEVQRQITLQEQRLQQLEAQTQMNEFLQWNDRIDNEMSALKTEFPMLDDNDLIQAKSYLLGTFRNTEIPLKQAVLAIHGEKIVNGLQDIARNEALAQASGRKSQSVVPPKGKASSKETALSADEAMVAKEIFGMTEEDYLKHK